MQSRSPSVRMRLSATTPPPAPPSKRTHTRRSAPAALLTSSGAQEILTCISTDTVRAVMRSSISQENAQLPFTVTHRLRVARLGLAMNKSK